VNKRTLFLILRILVSCGLVAYVCSLISLRDVVELKTGEEIRGYIQEESASGIVIRDLEGNPVRLSMDQIAVDDEGLPRATKGLRTIALSLRPVPSVLGFLLFGGIILLSGVRWRILLQAQRITLGIADAVRLVFIGLFFNNIMLGSTGGDVAKAYYITRKTDRKVEGALTVFVDRLVGIVALALIAGAAALFRLGDPEVRLIYSAVSG